MFVVIIGDFLVFFLQEKKKRKEAKFLYRMSLGCSAITLTCTLALFFPSLSRNRQCFPFQLPLTVAESVPLGSVLGLLLVWNMVGRMTGPNITASMDVGRHYERK